MSSPANSGPPPLSSLASSSSTPSNNKQTPKKQSQIEPPPPLLNQFDSTAKPTKSGKAQQKVKQKKVSKVKKATNNKKTKQNGGGPPPPPELAPLSSPSPSPDKESKDKERFKGIKIPIGWLECPLEFIQPLRDHRILVCKTPIDREIAKYFKIPKDKWFLPHTIYTLPGKHYNDKQQKQQQQQPHPATDKKRKIGLVIDLTNQQFYDEISFNNGKKLNKVKRRIIPIENLEKPSEVETSGFVGLVRSFLNGAANQDKWIVIHDDLGHNLAGFMCSAFMVKELNYSVDAAVYQFSQSRKPGIYKSNFIKLLHEMYSDQEDVEIFETRLKIKPLDRPIWLKQLQPQIRTPSSPKQLRTKNTNNGTNKKSQFAVPTSSIRRKRSFSEMNNNNNSHSSSNSDSDNNSNNGHNNNKNKNNNNNSSLSSLVEEPSLLSEPTLLQEPMDNASNNSDNSNNSPSSSNLIMEPTLLEPMEPTLIGETNNNEPPMKKQKIMSSLSSEVHVPPELKQDHPYLIAVRDQHLQHLTTIALQLSKNKDLFHSIQTKPATVPRNSMMALKANYRISWLGHGHRFWLMILGKKGCFFVDPSYFTTGKLGGIYHIEGTHFHNVSNNKYLDGTLCCGELVIDNIIKNKQSGEIKKVPRFLITDLLVIDKSSLSKFPHTERLMRAENYLYRPFAKSLATSKLRIRVKPMYPIENQDIIAKLQRMIDKELPHKCDGLGLWPIKPPFGQRLLRIAL